jgi:hypothetical protein
MEMTKVKEDKMEFRILRSFTRAYANILKSKPGVGRSIPVNTFELTHKVWV